VDDLDGPPTARGARNRLHDRRERAAPDSELVRHVCHRARVRRSTPSVRGR